MTCDINLGFKNIDNIYLPCYVNVLTHCHWLVVGGSGSGKTVFLEYVLNHMLDTSITLYIADFKGSGDLSAITPFYSEFDACIELIEDFYTKYQEIKLHKTGERILLIFDEYAGFMVWLESKDKKKATEIKGKIAEILMQGRALPGGGSAWFWCVCQRADSCYFSHGARENFMLSIGFSNLSKESKVMLGFHAEDIPTDYKPSTGRALLSVDGHDLTVLQVPRIDISRLKLLLAKKAAHRTGIAGS